MKVVFDASSLLNLANGSVLDTVLAIRRLDARFGPLVRRECASIAAQLDALLEQGRITLLDDDQLPASLFLSMLERHGLGAGETECLAFASLGDDFICCDDRRARAVVTNELGAGRITGSLGLLIKAVHQELLTIDSALAAYEQMRRLGGFLPEVSVDDLTQALLELKNR